MGEGFNRYKMLIFDTVVDVVALSGFHLLFKVGDAVLDQDVVPLEQFADIAVVNSFTVEIWRNILSTLFPMPFYS